MQPNLGNSARGQPEGVTHATVHSSPPGPSLHSYRGRKQAQRGEACQFQWHARHLRRHGGCLQAGGTNDTMRRHCISNASLFPGSLHVIEAKPTVVLFRRPAHIPRNRQQNHNVGVSLLPGFHVFPILQLLMCKKRALIPNTSLHSETSVLRWSLEPLAEWLVLPIRKLLHPGKHIQRTASATSTAKSTGIVT